MSADRSDPPPPPVPLNRYDVLLTGPLAVTVAASVVVTVIAGDPREETAQAAVVAALAWTIAILLRRRRSDRVRLQEARLHVEAVSESSDTLVWESDSAGNLIMVGRDVEMMFGYTQKEARHLNLRDVVHPAEFERLARYVQAGEAWTKERWRCLLKDGTERWFTGSAVPRRDARGMLLGYLGTSRPLGVDELEQQRLSQEAEQVYAVIAQENIRAVFQPIISVETGRIVGVEALSRFPHSPRGPEYWFAAADEVGLGIELQLAALRAQLAATAQLPQDVYVSVNVSPAALSHAELREALLTSQLELSRLVLEITEHETVGDYDSVLREITELRAHGVRVAVDDAGAGYASFRHILRLKPEIIKLDRSLVSGIDQDPALRALATAVVSFGRSLHARVCAEGIESLAEFSVLRELGIDKAQGYLFGRPTDDWSTWNQWHREVPVLSSRHRRGGMRAVGND